MKPLAIFGAGGMARDAFLFARDMDLKVEAFFDIAPGDKLFDTPVLSEKEFEPAGLLAVVAVGSPALRKKISTRLLSVGAEFFTLIHPSVSIYDRESVSIGLGAVICPRCLLTCDNSFGVFPQLNYHTTVGHDSRFGDYFTASPGVNIGGRVIIHDNVFVGSNATIRTGVNVASDVIIGAGACVVKDITEPGVYVGVPARKIR